MLRQNTQRSSLNNLGKYEYEAFALRRTLLTSLLCMVYTNYMLLAPHLRRTTALIGHRVVGCPSVTCTQKNTIQWITITEQRSPGSSGEDVRFDLGLHCVYIV